MARGFRDLAKLAAQAAQDKKGEDVLLLDVHKTSTLTDYLLVVSVLSPAHLEAIESAIDDVMEQNGVQPRHRDGGKDLWKVLDYGGLMVHLMHPQARDFYALDKLYHDAPRRKIES